MKNFYLKIKKLTNLVLLAGSLLLASGARAQTTLAAGDIAFTGYDSSPLAGTGDSFSFVLLTNISNGTKISFTDRGYSGAGWQVTGGTESSITWTSSTALSLGTEVYIVGLVASTYNPIALTSTVNGTVTLTEGTSTNGLSLSNVGDQIIAFQGGNGSITGSGAYAVAGINYFYATGTTVAGWNLTASVGPNASLMPPGLTGGTSAFYTGSVTGNTLAQSGKFNCAGMPTTTAANVRSAVMNLTNWTLSTSSLGQYSGCTFISSTPVITGNPPNRTICAGGNTTFSINATGATSYQWYQNTGSGFTALSNTAPYSGVTTNTLTLTGVTAILSGSLYQCIATNTSGSATSNSATLTVVTVSANGVKTDVSCNGGSNGTINLTPTGGITPYTFNWGGGITTEDRTGLAAGTYTVAVTDNIGCTATNSFIIGQPATVVSGTRVITNISCNGGSNGAINLTPAGGTSPYTFNWGGGITTEDRTGLAVGTYTVTITDANGCTATVNATVTQPATAVSGTTIVTNMSCNGGTNGAINLTPVGGASPYTFNWGGGITTEDRTGLAAGTYTVIITDANGCTTTVNATVTQPATAVSGTTVITNISCNGGTNGTINLTPTGGASLYTFNWGGGITTEDRTGLAVGTYTVTITDTNGCTATVNATVTQPATAVSGTTVITNISCNGGSNGAINLTPAGGTSPYTFNWGGGIITEDRTGLAAGTYTVIITDANGCTTTVNAIVTQPATAVSGTTVITNISCNGGSNGAINLTPTGGASPYTFNWGGGITTEDRTGLAAGTYTVIITDANGCTTTVNATVTQPATAVSGTTVITNISCNGGSNGAINLTPAGGASPYTFNWGGGITTEDRTGLAVGTYTVTITDANGCTATVNATVTQPIALAATISQTNVSCNGGSNGTATISVSGGTAPYTYSWSPSGGTVGTANGLIAGIYTVTATDANSCTITRTVTITQASVVGAPTGAAIQSFNNGDTLSALAVTGQNIKWYATASNAANHTGSLAMTTVIVNNTTYYATQTSGGCESTASLAILAYNATLSIGNVVKADTGMQVYPNPVADILKVSGKEKIIKLVLFTADGKKLTEKVLSDGERGINVSSLVQGIYIIQVFTENQVKNFKFIKR